MARTISFPHPVLGHSNDLIGSLNAEIDMTVGDRLVLACSLSVDNKSILAAIADGIAVYGVRLNCSQTYYRRTFQSADPTFELEIPIDDMRGSISLETFVLARNMIPGYRPSGLHSDYGSAVFEIKPAQILALGPSGKFDLDINFDPLQNPMSSIIKISKKKQPDQPFSVDYEEKFITVCIDNKDWEHYQGVKTKVPYAILCGIALPVLAEALRRLGQPGSQADYDELLWSRRLNKVLEARNIDREGDPLQQAQAILGNPLALALNQLDDVLHQEGD